MLIAAFLVFPIAQEVANPLPPTPCRTVSCAPTEGGDAERMILAWRSDATTQQQRAKMEEFVQSNVVNGRVDWPKASSQYFEWRADDRRRSQPGFVDYDRMRKVGEAAILSQLRNPDTGKVRWDKEFIVGDWKPDLFEKRIRGYVPCGLVNGQNGFGGYTGFTRFSIVVRDFQVVHLAMDGEGDGLNALLCQKAGLPNRAIE